MTSTWADIFLPSKGSPAEEAVEAAAKANVEAGAWVTSPGEQMAEGDGKSVKYSDDEARDDHGRWTSGGSSAGSNSGDMGTEPPEREWQTGEVTEALHKTAATYAKAAISGGQVESGTTESAAVTDYLLAEGCSQINGALRAGAADSSDTVQTIFGPGNTVGEDVQSLDGLIAKSATTEDMTVYRGFRGTDLDVKVGDTISEPGYVSTSLLEGVASKWASGGSLVKLSVPAGTPAMSMTNVVGEAGGLSEVVLPRGSAFNVTGIEPDGTIEAAVQ